MSTAGSVTIEPGAVFEQNTTAQLAFGSVNVLPGGTLTHGANATTRAAVLNLSVSGNFNLQAGSSIAVSGQGYAGSGINAEMGGGPGGGSYAAGDGGGGGHGGAGGPGTTSFGSAGGAGGAGYDSVTNPTDLGSAGGGGNTIPGGGGGGAVLIAVGGTLTVNGTINANGGKGLPNGAYSAGGGAGGTVNINATTFTGTGAILANGGAGGNGQLPGGGGGGGLISITVTGTDNSNLSLQAFSGNAGATGATGGGAGIVAIEDPGASNYSLTIGTSTITPQSLTAISGSSLSFGTLTLYNSIVSFDANSTVNVNSLAAVGVTTLTANALVFGSSGIEVKPGGVLMLTANSASGGALLVDGSGVFEQMNAAQLDFTSVTVAAGGVLTHASNTTTRTAVLNLNVSGNFNLQAGSTISVCGQGYAGSGINAEMGGGSGGGSYASGDGGGGGHGGAGGPGSAGGAGGPGYDSVTNPTDLGSAGGGGNAIPGGGGGGAVLIAVGGTLTVNGTINANGGKGLPNGAYSAGGGAGGTVNITAATFNGTGTVLANGGVGGNGQLPGGGGGGGLIAITVTGTDNSNLNLQALSGNAGGTGATNGGAGVISLKTPGGNSYNLTIGDLTATPQSATGVAGSSLTFSTVTLSNSIVNFDADSTVNINSLVISGKTILTANNLLFGSSGIEIKPSGVLMLTASSASGGALLVDGGGVFEEMNNTQLMFTSVTIAPGGVLTHAANTTTRAAVLNLNVSGNFDLQAGSSISVSGQGYAGSGINAETGGGPGGGSYASGDGGGGGHGGAGGQGATAASAGGAGGPGYDSVTDPTDLGSAGGGGDGIPGGSGGGAVLIAVSGTLTVNGTINANGSNGAPNGAYSAGGGAGGTVNINAATFNGTGAILANGGAGGNGQFPAGGGGGGLISITVTGTDTSNLSLQAFSGNSGGAGSTSGGAGIIAIEDPGASSYSLTIGTSAFTAQSLTTITGSSPSFATLTLSNSIVSISSISVGSLFVRGGGIFDQLNKNFLAFNSVEVDSGGVITHFANPVANQNAINFNVSGNFNLLSGGAIVADGLGYAGSILSTKAGAGPGGGQTGQQSGGGGGHGGPGGNGDSGAAGGATNDSFVNPSDGGSGGGNSNENVVAGSGGGVVRIKVGGVFTDNGVITVNGTAGQSGGLGTGGGGGAGGTVNITASSLAGPGIVRANGGSGSSSGGAGGGGGIIVLNTNTNTQPWTLQANGGSAVTSFAGGNLGSPGVIVDNGQLLGAVASSTNTALVSLQPQLTASQSLTANLSVQNLNFTGATSTGVIPGNFIAAQMQVVTIQNGPFAESGFFNGTWSLPFLAGTGTWQGTAYLVSSPRQIVLNGSLEGGIRGILQGILTESSPGSGSFNQMALNGTAIEFSGNLGTGGLYFSGNGTYAPITQYSNVPMTLLQDSMTGQTNGSSIGALQTNFSLLLVNSPGNPLNNEGFMLPTYTSSLGSGSGWAYASAAGNAVSLTGLLGYPLLNMLEGALVTTSPNSLFFTLSPLNIGGPLQPQYVLTKTGPDVFFAGSTVTFSVALTNVGSAATSITLVAIYPEWTNFVSASGNYTVYKTPYWIGNTFAADPFVRWDNVVVPPNTTSNYYYQAYVRLPTTGAPPAHTPFSWDVRAIPTAWANQMFAPMHPGLTP